MTRIDNASMDIEAPVGKIEGTKDSSGKTAKFILLMIASAVASALFLMSGFAAGWVIRGDQAPAVTIIEDGRILPTLRENDDGAVTGSAISTLIDRVDAWERDAPMEENRRLSAGAHQFGLDFEVPESASNGGSAMMRSSGIDRRPRLASGKHHVPIDFQLLGSLIPPGASLNPNISVASSDTADNPVHLVRLVNESTGEPLATYGCVSQSSLGTPMCEELDFNELLVDSEGRSLQATTPTGQLAKRRRLIFCFGLCIGFAIATGVSILGVGVGMGYAHNEHCKNGGKCNMAVRGGGGSCHPSSSTLDLADGRSISMSDAHEGDLIRTPNGFEPILGFLHFDKVVAGDYYRFHTNTSASLAISDFHWLYVNGKHASPSSVRAGDVLNAVEGAAEVIQVEKRIESGAIHPIVRGGMYYADGLLASDYNEKVPQTVWEVVRAYAAARFSLGVPIVPEGVALINPFWAFDNDEYVTPAFLRPLCLLTVPMAVATDLINTVAAYPTKAAASMVIAALGWAGARKGGKLATKMS